MQKHQYNIFQIIMFLIFPLISIPLILQGLRRHYKVSMYLLCLLFSVIALYIAPNYDVINHGYFAYEYYSSDIYWIYFANTDFFLQFIGVLLLKNNLSYHYTVFIFVLISSIAIFNIYWDIAKNKTEEERKKMLRLFLVLYPFLLVILGLRFGLAVCLLISTSYFYICKKSKIAMVILCCIPLVHISFICHVLVVLLYKYNKFKLNLTFAVVLFIMLCLLSIPIIKLGASLLEGYVNSTKIEQYTDENNLDFFANQNLNYFVLYYAINVFSVPLMLLLLYRNYNILSSHILFPTYIVFVLLYAISFDFTILSDRFGDICTLAMFILIVLVFSDKINKGRLYDIIFYTQILAILLTIFMRRNILLFESYKLLELLYTPFPMLFIENYNFEDYKYLYYRHIAI